MNTRDKDAWPHFICRDLLCKSPLELIAVTKTIDGGVCGDGLRKEFYQCEDCKKIYSRNDLDSPERFLYSEHQHELRECEALPENVEFSFILKK